LIDENKVVCCPIPVFHVFGLITGALNPFVYSSKVVFPHLFPEPTATLKAIQAEKCTSIKGAPVIYMVFNFKIYINSIFLLLS